MLSADSDYVSASGPVVFPAGQNETSVQVSIIDDSTYEGNEYFSVGLRTTRSGTGVAFTQDVATVTIQDDDGNKGHYGFCSLGYVRIYL